jgi:thioredoxin reductase (NADPH)
MPVQLTIFVREGCHLCEDMEQALWECATELDFETRRVLIDNNAELEMAYGDKVPVLVCGDEELCHYFLDLQALRRVCD